ncbi:MAG: DUF2203 domain-containing protein [Chloroflexota bacterium]|nr:DUF2203 domain-containing protein [Chloroflexota bacterium]
MKTFTLEEANALVSQLDQLLEELTGLRDRIIAMGPSLQAMLEHAGGNGGSQAGGEYVILLQRFNAGLSFFKDIGCELKDLDQGLVDFPSYREDKLVYLCWKRGEPRIEFWHDLESGFGGRQPL